MVPLIRKYILGNSEKNNAASYIFIILCAYTVITAVYTQIFFDLSAAAVRFAISIVATTIFVVFERGRLGNAMTAFLSPTLIAVSLIFGAIYFKGDGLLFNYLNP